ncbi:MAG: hypothetical protein KC635_08845 [Myxococcales bacterium]|nr:hypothetical protein [Myxococcales bacterium]MCB9736840.1 hypothetical protein [Deltaproteobacteria bacterium]
MTKPSPTLDVKPWSFGQHAPSEQKPGFMRGGNRERVVTWVPGGEVTESPPPPPAAKAPAKPAAAATGKGAAPPPPGGGAKSEAPKHSPAPEPPEEEDAAPVVPPGSLIVSEADLEAREQELVDVLREPYRAAARDLKGAIIELQQRLHEDLVDLAGRFAQALIYREVRLDRGIMLDIAHRALRMAGTMERVVIKCSEEDAPVLREELGDLARSEAGQAVEVVVRPSDDIDVGGCLLTFEGGIVDARNEKRLERLMEVVKAAVSDAPVAEAHGSTHPPAPAPPAAEEREEGPT